MDRFRPNFIYLFILARSTLGLLAVIFCTLVPMLWPLIYAKILILFNILRANVQNFTTFYTCIHIDKIYVGFVTHHFWHICTRVIALDLCQNFTNGKNFAKFYICIHIYKIYVGIVTHNFSHICTRVLALDLLQNVVSTQYLENKWTDFDQTLYNYLY